MRPPIEQPVAAKFAAEEDVLGDRAERDEVDLLVDRADAAVLRSQRAKQTRSSRRRTTISPASLRWAPVSTLISVDLPAPFWPTSPMTLSRLDLERARRASACAPMKPLVDVAHGEERSTTSASGLRPNGGAQPHREPLPPALTAGGRGFGEAGPIWRTVRTRSPASLWRWWRRRTGPG